jgi:hypothetical protein
MLFVRQRRRLARGAARHKAFGAFGNLPLDQGFERSRVHAFVLEWRDQGGDGSLEHGGLIYMRECGP